MSINYRLRKAAFTLCFVAEIGFLTAGRNKFNKKCTTVIEYFKNSRNIRAFSFAEILLEITGRVAERLKAPVLKTGKGLRPSWVQIPPLPPFIKKALDLSRAFFIAGLFAEDGSITEKGFGI